MTQNFLPTEFADLEVFAAQWGDLDSMDARYLKRQDSNMEELKAFYNAMAPRLDEIFGYLERFPDDNLPEPEARLYRTALGLIEAAAAVEYFGQPRMIGAPYPHSVQLEIAEY